MPFISKDWRSPGEEWVKTQEGWEKKKVLECSAKLHGQRFDDISTFSKTENQENTWPSKETGGRELGAQVPPHCHITVKCTREIAGFNGLSEAVRRLDFASAVRDSRRFNYCCALLQLLVGGTRLTALPGAAQRLLLAMLEEVATQVAESRQNIGALRALASALAAVREGEVRACWGRPLGSRALWRQHRAALARFDDIASRAHARAVEPMRTDHEDVALHIHDLPEECVREILLRIADHRDLEASSAAWSVMASLCSEKRIWRELVHVHFTPAQVEQAVREDKNKLEGKVDWKAVYHSLRKQFGLREDLQFAETLSLCRHCKCLFWRSQGHPCIVDQCPEYRERLKEAGGPLPPHPIPPAAFLKFFSL